MSHKKFKKDDKVKVIKLSGIVRKYKKVGDTGKIVKTGFFSKVYFDEYPHTSYDVFGIGYDKAGWTFNENKLELVCKEEKFKSGDKVVLKDNLEYKEYDYKQAKELQEVYGYFVIRSNFYSHSCGKSYKIYGLQFGLPISYVERYKVKNA